MNKPDYIRLEVNKEKHLLYSLWLRETTSEELRQGVLQFLKVIQEAEIWYWVLDARVLRSPSFTDQQWILKEVSPVLIHSSLLKLARIGNNDVFNYITYENIAEKTHEQFKAKAEFAQFTSYEAAMDWINMED
ncbi:hypothetical protein [Pontibacter chitinilyticus]|uniref:hypothetical protein n=1 Tax=Pontibacter chitinilyticus TaxID=2674989 RepID=UPI00321902C7